MQDPNTDRLAVYWNKKLKARLQTAVKVAGESTSVFIGQLIAAELNLSDEYAQLTPGARTSTRKVTIK